MESQLDDGITIPRTEIEEARMDAVITAAFGYEPSILLPFITSLRKVFGERLILFILESQEKAMLSLADKFNIELVVRNMRAATPPHYDRYLAYKEYLEKQKNLNRIFLTDSRDVLFQKSPFTNDSTHLYSYTEPKQIKYCSLNQSWIAKYYGRQFLEDIQENPIICSGTTMGTYNECLDYVKIMCNEIQRNIDSNISLGIDDQGMHNKLWYTGAFPKGEIRLHGLSEVQTLHYENQFCFDRECFLLNKDGTRVPVIHQYDRHSQFFPLFAKMVNRE